MKPIPAPGFVTDLISVMTTQTRVGSRIRDVTSSQTLAVRASEAGDITSVGGLESVSPLRVRQMSVTQVS